MNLPMERLQYIAALFLRFEDVAENLWTAFAFIFEFNEGDIANSGLLYNNDKVELATASG